MNPLKTVNLIIYYGALIHKSDYEMLVKHLNMQQLYTTISQTGLTFKDVGKIGSSWDYVVGKELKWEFEKNYISYEIIDNELYIDGQKLNVVDKDDVKIKLASLNITREPKFYIFNSWLEEDIHEIKES